MLSMFYGKAHRVPPTRSSLPEQSSVSGVSPSPASPSPAPPSEPSDWVLLYSPGPSRIKSKSDDGEIITLEDGSLWRVYPPDRIHTASWTRMTYLDVVGSGIVSPDLKRAYLLINHTKGEKPMRNFSTLHPQNRGILPSKTIILVARVAS